MIFFEFQAVKDLLIRQLPFPGVGTDRNGVPILVHGQGLSGQSYAIFGEPFNEKLHRRGSVRQFGPGFFLKFSLAVADLLEGRDIPRCCLAEVRFFSQPGFISLQSLSAPLPQRLTPLAAQPMATIAANPRAIMPAGYRNRKILIYSRFNPLIVVFLSLD